MQEKLAVNKKELSKFLKSIYRTDVNVKEIHELSTSKEGENIKEFGYGVPLRIDVDAAGIPDQIVLHTLRPDKFGHERRSDRARNIILDYDTFNALENHVPALGLGVFTESGGMQSLINAEEFFLITRYSPGRLYVEDLKNLTTSAQLLPEDRQRILMLSRYLADIHDTKKDKPSLYKRCVRDLLGHGEGIMGLIDSYPPDYDIATPARFKAIERRLIEWRWRLKTQVNRLSQVHGDFHPWNILFQRDNEFALLDRSRGAWGEPADDVSALSINLIFFSLRQHGDLRGVYRVLFELFWEEYLGKTQDIALSRVIQPFYVWRALVLAHPVWYPNLKDEIREQLFVFIEYMLSNDWFEPQKVNEYLRNK